MGITPSSRMFAIEITICSFNALRYADAALVLVSEAHLFSYNCRQNDQHRYVIGIYSCQCGCLILKKNQTFFDHLKRPLYRHVLY
jgi:hypothetical protein